MIMAIFGMWLVLLSPIWIPILFFIAMFVNANVPNKSLYYMDKSAKHQARYEQLCQEYKEKHGKEYAPY